MSPRRRIAPHAGQAALAAAAAGQVDRRELATAVRYGLEELAHRHPGGSIEVRVPPYGVTQLGLGPRHTRGTPPNVVEMAPATFVQLAVGKLTWGQALAAGAVSASGTRADLAVYLPLEQI